MPNLLISRSSKRYRLLIIRLNFSTSLAQSLSVIPAEPLSIPPE
jgi:hypothetical protein